MPGFLSNVFDQGGEGRSADDAQHVGSDGQSDIDLAFTVQDSETVHADGMDGSSHDFSNEQDATLTFSGHAVLAVAADASQGAFSGDGFEE